jgi:hypothetical protein
MSPQGLSYGVPISLQGYYTEVHIGPQALSFRIPIATKAYTMGYL